ncbi:MAG: signal peptidase I [Alphaproteobacteria bacterium]|nr:signal peptidase I [Alphaproteobacteria bacterium]
MMKKPFARSLVAWLIEPLAMVILMVCATTAIAQPFYIPSGSMEPTLQIGDMLLGTKYAYGYSRWSLPGGYGPASEKRLFGKLPARGDVVIFKKTEDTGTTLIKRVVGLPGDRIQMVHGHLVINGKTLPLVPAGAGEVEDAHGDHYPIQKFTETLPGGVKHTIFKAGWDGPLDDTLVYVVPAGHVFGMGDNRDNSADSRVPVEQGGPGYIPAENLVARADVMLGSYDYLGVRSIGSALSGIRLSRFLRPI